MEISDELIKHSKEYLMCSAHPSKLAKKYCTQCKNFICNACALEDHSDHIDKLSKLNLLYINNKELLNKFLSLSSANLDLSSHNSIKFKCMNFIFHEAKNYCKVCKKFICVKCSITHFDGEHQIIEIKNYFSMILEKIEFFIQVIKNLDDWNLKISHSKLISNLVKQRENFENKFLNEIFEKFCRTKINIEDVMNKRKNFIISVFDELNKFLVLKRNILAQNKKKIEEIENIYKMIKFEKDATKVYDKFIDFELFVDSMITETEKERFKVLFSNLKKLDEIMEEHNEKLLNNLNGEFLERFHEELFRKIEDAINDNQCSFENDISVSLKLSRDEYENMISKKEKISKYLNEEEVKLANLDYEKTNNNICKESIKPVSGDDKNEADLALEKDPILKIKSEINPSEKQIISWIVFEPVCAETINLFSTQPSNVNNKIRFVEPSENFGFTNLLIENNCNFALSEIKSESLINNSEVEESNLKLKNQDEGSESVVYIKLLENNEEKLSKVESEEKSIYSNNETASLKKDDNPKIQIEDNPVEEEIADDAFSQDDSDKKSSNKGEQEPKAIEEKNAPNITEKRKSLDSEISKINIYINESNAPQATNYKESEIINFDNQVKEEENKEENTSVTEESYFSLSLPEKIILAKKKIQIIRDDQNLNSDYVEISNQGVEVDKNKISEITINQLLEKMFSWEERNQFELISIGHNIKTIFIYNPLVDRIKEIEFINKFPTFHSYLNILPWTYISGGKDIDTNQENNLFFKLRRESEKSFELVNLSPMNSKRSAHIIIHHANSNSIFAISGSRNFSCERYEIVNDKWILLPNLNSSREKAAACLFSGNEEYLYVFSGFDRTINKCINTVERLNLNKLNSKWEFIQIKGIQNLLKRQALSCLYFNNTQEDNPNQDSSLFFDNNQIYLLGGINLLKNETKDVLLFNLKNNHVSNHPKLVMNENFAFNHSQFVNIPLIDSDIFYNFSDNFSVVMLDSKMKNFRSRKLDFI